jgi:hypothetical protein
MAPQEHRGPLRPAYGPARARAVGFTLGGHLAGGFGGKVSHEEVFILNLLTDVPGRALAVCLAGTRWRQAAR